MPPPSQAPASRLAPLLASEPVGALRRVAAGAEVYLVGGAVRDALLGRPRRDLDAVTAAPAGELAERLAAELGGRLVRLGGEEFATWRVARRGLVVDLAQCWGGSLAADLGRRDVTVNAIAADLATGALLDPWGGLEDLVAGRLRAPRLEAFDADPLRVLRLARFAASLAFGIDVETAAAARRAAARLAEVAAERIQVELELALPCPDGVRLLAALVEVGLYPGLLRGRPADPGPTAAARRRHVALGDAESWLERELPHLAVATHRAALRGAALLLDLAELPAPVALAGLRRRRWLSRRRAESIARLLPWIELPAAAGARRWLLHSTGEAWAAGLLLAATAPRPPSGPDWRAAARDIARLVGEHGPQLFDPPPLLDGHEVGQRTGLPPGPELGKVVAHLRRLQIEGELADAVAARRWLTRTSHGDGPRRDA